MKRVNTIIEVTFGGEVIATTPLKGSTPMWRESISFRFRPPENDFNPHALNNLREMISFSLFDIVDEDDEHRGGYMEGDKTSRTEKRFLGTFSVPFVTLYHRSTIEGIFRLNTPLFNFGYETIATSTLRNEPLPDPDTEDDDILQEICGSPALYNIWNSAKQYYTAVNDFFKKKALITFKDGSYIQESTTQELPHYCTGGSSTFFHVMMTFDPLLLTAPEVEEEMTIRNVIQDDIPFIRHCSKWMDDVKNAINPVTSTRSYKVFCQNSSGLYVFIPRFLTPTRPPSGFENRRACIHLVSNIPFLPDSNATLNEMDLWCTGKEMWDIGAGDEEEHATTLYNYLYYLNIKNADRTVKSANAPNSSVTRSIKDLSSSYPTDEYVAKESLFLVIGNALPEGSAVYVLSRDGEKAKRGSQEYDADNFFVINPCNGQIFSCVDPNCPLQEIYMMATPYNIWANIQISAKPCKMKYNVLNPQDWRPFIGSRIPPPVGGIHTIQEKVNNTVTNSNLVSDIEVAVKTAIRNNMRKWRSKRARASTTIHPEASSLMSEALADLEKWCRGQSLESNLQSTLQQDSSFGSLRSSRQSLRPNRSTESKLPAMVNGGLQAILDRSSVSMKVNV